MPNSRHSGPEVSRNHPSLSLLLVAYTATLLLFLFGSHFTEQRVWGASTWGYFATWTQWLLFIAGLSIAIAVVLYSRRSATLATSDGDLQKCPVRYAVCACVFVLLAGASFYLFRARTFFLGDGYLQLATLAKDIPLLKGRDFGEMRLHIWVKSLFGGEGRHAAQLSYQWLSIAAGVLFASASAVVAGALFSRTMWRMLFLIGMCTGGYALLFFGYVENYSLLCLSIGLFTLVGMLIATKRLSRWWILLPLAGSLFFHVLGVTLVPAAFYILTASSAFSRFVKRWHTGLKVVITAAVAVALGAAFYHFYTTNYFFRFAFVPLTHSQFTTEGYTLLSGKHVADYGNLLIVLFPAVLLFPFVSQRFGSRLARGDTQIRFLAILVASTLGASFIFEAKLGMPRDWDLFSFPGIPLTALFFALALLSDLQARLSFSVAALAIALNAASLIPRVGVQMFPEQGIERFVHYITLDPLKNRSGAYVLQQYFEEGGDTTIVAGIRARRAQDYPEERLAYEAGLSFGKRDVSRAKQLSEMAIDLNPAHSTGWLNLGRALTAMQQYDSALTVLRIADGLNPYSAQILGELGIAYYNMKQFDKAERCWRRAISIDPDPSSPIMALARLYQMEGREKEYLKYLILASSKEDALGSFSVELGDQFLKQGAYEPAAEAYSQALARGIDTTVLESRLRAHPRLREYLSK